MVFSSIKSKINLLEQIRFFLDGFSQKKRLTKQKSNKKKQQKIFFFLIYLITKNLSKKNFKKYLFFCYK